MISWEYIIKKHQKYKYMVTFIVTFMIHENIDILDNYLSSDDQSQRNVWNIASCEYYLCSLSSICFVKHANVTIIESLREITSCYFGLRISIKTLYILHALRMIQWNEKKSFLLIKHLIIVITYYYEIFVFILS